MKNILLILLTAFTFATLNAQSFTYGDLNYEVNDDGVSVTLLEHADGYAASGTLNIPEYAMFNGQSYAVTIIDDYAFYYCEGLTGPLVIPNTVEEIKDEAFYHCPGFTSLTLSHSLIEIGDDAFDYCIGISGTVIVPSSVEYIGYNPFYGCTQIEGFVVEAGNEYYDSRDNCNAVIHSYDDELIIGCKNSTIPYTVESIGEDAFGRCDGLTAITIPTSVTAIGGWSFWFCTSLTSITIPSSVTYIGINPFGGCTALETIAVEVGNPIYDSRGDCNAIIKTSENELISGCQNTVIPSDVTRIGKDAFYYCTLLSGELVIPDNIVSIGEYAYEGCTGLTGSLVIPNTVLEIGESAFAYCSGFDGTLTLSESLTTILNWTFEECPGFTGSLVIPNAVTTIGSSAFEGCYGFDGTLTLSKNLVSISNFSFASCSGFREVVALASEPAALGDYPFGGFGSTILIVPCGCGPAYQNSPWYDQFTNILEDCEAISKAEVEVVKVYPNPTQGRVSIEAKGLEQVTIYNLLGEKMFENAVSSDIFEVDFGKLSKGLYLIEIKTNIGVSYEKIENL